MNQKVLIIISLLFLVIGVFVFNSKKKAGQSDEESQVSGVVQLVDSESFSKLAKNEKNFLLDVHIPEQDHIPRTDTFIPYTEIYQNINKLPQDKSTTILVYCRSGSMSKAASEEIAKLGFTNVYNLKGGIDAYKESNVEITITPSNQDLREVIYGEVAKTSFTLINFTPLPVKIIRISTSCGCTKAEVEKKDLKAYESTEIKVSFDPAVHKDETDLGEVTRTIYINTDNPNFPQLTSTITADVIPKW